MKTRFTKLFFPVVIVLSSFIGIIHSSCNRDLCKTIACANKGVCDRGTCICPAGYQGTNCETQSSIKFLGAWNVLEKGSTTASAQYPVGISQMDNVTGVAITNFFNYFTVPVNAYIVNDSIYIPNQQLQGKVIFGKGYISSSSNYGQYASITMFYEVIDTATGVVDDFGYYPPDLSAPSQWNK